MLSDTYIVDQSVFSLYVLEHLLRMYISVRTLACGCQKLCCVKFGQRVYVFFCPSSALFSFQQHTRILSVRQALLQQLATMLSALLSSFSSGINVPLLKTEVTINGRSTNSMTLHSSAVATNYLITDFSFIMSVRNKIIS